MTKTGPSSSSVSAMRLLRQASQVVFFALWYYLFLRTYVIVDVFVIHGNPVPDIFLKADPLAGIISSAAARAFSQEVAWWMGMIGLTVLFGRGFCGWVCPLGTWLDLRDRFMQFWNNRVAKFKCRLPGNRVRGFRQKMEWKYGILVSLLVCSLFSVSLAGYMDPLCIMERAFAFSFLPAAGEAERVLSGVNRVFGYGFTRAHFYGFNMIAGGMFIGVLALNVYARRFWCRVLCPLGALLGAVGKMSFMKLRVNRETCTGCLKCSVECKMGAIDFPAKKEPVSGYRKEECIQCFICTDVCPHDSITIAPSFRFWEQTAKTPEGSRS